MVPLAYSFPDGERGVSMVMSMMAGPEQRTLVVRLRPSDWGVLKMVRLRALKDSPKSFAAEYMTERLLPRAVWQSRLAGSTWVIARQGPAQEIVGVAHLGSLPFDHVGPDRMDVVRYVESVWVAPSARGLGVARQMIDELAECAREQGIFKLLLWVFEHNHEAWEAYERMGFRPTGEEQQLLAQHGRLYLERRMAKTLELTSA